MPLFLQKTCLWGYKFDITIWYLLKTGLHNVTNAHMLNSGITVASACCKYYWKIAKVRISVSDLSNLFKVHSLKHRHMELVCIYHENYVTY